MNKFESQIATQFESLKTSFHPKNTVSKTLDILVNLFSINK